MKQHQVIFGKNMVLKAKANGISQTDISYKIGVHQGLISEYKNGNKTISLEKAVCIANLLNCSMDELLGRYEYISKNENVVNSLMEEKYLDCQKENIALKRENTKLITLINELHKMLNEKQNGQQDLNKISKQVHKLYNIEE